MRSKHEFRTGSKENFNLLKELHPTLDINFQQYLNIIHTYNELVFTHILETGESYKMPYGLGKLTINKYRPNKPFTKANGKEYVGLSIDWPATKEHGKYIYHLNHHTDGFKYYWMWNISEARIRRPKIWKFEMCRIPKRLLPEYLRKPNSDYKNIYRQHSTRKKSFI